MRTTRKRLLANEENMNSVLSRYEDKMNSRGWTLDHSSITIGAAGLKMELYIDAYKPLSTSIADAQFICDLKNSYAASEWRWVKAGVFSATVEASSHEANNFCDWLSYVAGIPALLGDRNEINGVSTEDEFASETMTALWDLYCKS